MPRSPGAPPRSRLPSRALPPDTAVCNSAPIGLRGLRGCVWLPRTWSLPLQNLHRNEPPAPGRGGRRPYRVDRPLCGTAPDSAAQRRGTCVVRLVMGEHACAVQGPRPSVTDRVIGTPRAWGRSDESIRQPQRLFQPSTAFGQIAARVPEVPHGGTQTECRVRGRAPPVTNATPRADCYGPPRVAGASGVR